MPRRRARSRTSHAPLHPKAGAHRIALGVYTAFNTTRFTNAVESHGGRVTWGRAYPQPATTCTAAQIESVIDGIMAGGMRPYISFKSSFTWEQVASGSDDTRFDAIGDMLATKTSLPGAWCFNHEPENDRTPGVDGTFGSPSNGAAFVAAWEHVASVIKPLAPNWQASINLFDEVFDSWEFGRGSNWYQTPDAHDWLSTEMDLLGIDYHAYRGASDTGFHWAQNDHIYDHQTAFTDFLSFASEYGVPLCVPEFSHIIKDPAGADPNDYLDRRAWLADFSATWAGHPQIDSVMYFEVNEQDDAAKANFSLTDDDHPPMDSQSVANFVALGD